MLYKFKDPIKFEERDGAAIHSAFHLTQKEAEQVGHELRIPLTDSMLVYISERRFPVYQHDDGTIETRELYTLREIDTRASWGPLSQ